MNNKTPVAFQLRTTNSDGIWYEYINFDDIRIDKRTLPDKGTWEDNGWMDSGSGQVGPAKRIFNISLPTDIFNTLNDVAETYSWKSISDNKTVNDTKTANIVNIWYKSIVVKVNYSANLMKTRMGGSPTAGIIDKISFYVTQVPTYPLPNFKLYIQNYSGSVDSPNNSSDWVNVYSSSSLYVSVGENQFTLSSPFSWNGGNISIASAFDRVPNYRSTGQNYTMPKSNGQARAWYNRTDGANYNINTSVSSDMNGVPVYSFHFKDNSPHTWFRWTGATLSS